MFYGNRGLASLLRIVKLDPSGSMRITHIGCHMAGTRPARKALSALVRTASSVHPGSCELGKMLVSGSKDHGIEIEEAAGEQRTSATVARVHTHAILPPLLTIPLLYTSLVQAIGLFFAPHRRLLREYPSGPVQMKPLCAAYADTLTFAELHDRHGPDYMHHRSCRRRRDSNAT